MGKRSEFSKATKRAALERSQMQCEAVGALYGLKPGIRCSISLSYGVEFDHIIACAIGGDNSLENCVSVCPKCHRFKSSTNDIPKAAKAKRVSDKAKGIKQDKPQIKNAGFVKYEKPEKSLSKMLPPRRGLYQEG